MDAAGLDQAVRASGFTGVVVVRHAGAIVFGEAYGYATPRWQIPNTVETRFDTASITKLFTSVAVLQQVGAGRLDLDASLADSVTVVEWGEGKVEDLSDERLEVVLARPAGGDGAADESRTVSVRPVGPRWVDANLAALSE